jgi:glycosyltransferase involved in cell wall biosynthesis
MNIAVFFTRSVSLEQWLEIGIFDREKQLYEEYLKFNDVDEVYWLTYGHNDYEIAKRLKSDGRLHPSITICNMPIYFNIPKVGALMYSFFLPIIHYKSLRQSHILKTNQIDGSWSAVIAAIIYKKKLILRTGYTKSLLLRRTKKSKIIVNLFCWIEFFAYKFCDFAIVSSSMDKEYLIEKKKISNNSITVIHNYVDTAKFMPKKINKYKNRVIFIGRLSHVKNLFNLLDAFSNSKITLDIYGDGELKNEIKLYIDSGNISANLKGVVSNNNLPEIINRYNFYILPSFYEGTPKALLEAMACGLVCIGSDVQGVSEIIQDGKNGYLIKESDSASILASLNRAFCSNNKNIMESARKTISEHYDLQSYVAQEKYVFHKLISEYDKNTI